MDTILAALCNCPLYRSHYCEENVYKLAHQYCNQTSKNDVSAFVVFVSNEVKQCPIWHQKLAARSGEPVLWDYHVIFCLIPRSNASTSVVIDLDTDMGFPIALMEYIRQSFRPEVFIKMQYRQ